MASMSRADRGGVYAPPSRGEPGFGPVAGLSDDDRDPRRGTVLLVVAVAVLLALVGAIWSAYHQGVRPGGREAPPHIAASEEPYKVRPDDAEAQSDARLELEFFDVMERPAERPQEDAEAARAALENEAPVVVAESEPPTASAPGAATVMLPRIKPLPRDETDTLGSLRAATAPRTLATAAAETAPSFEDLDGPYTDAELGADDAAERDEPDLAFLDRIEGSQSAPAAGVTRPTGTAGFPPATPSPDLSARGAFLVQIASLRSEGDAQTEWRDFRRDFPDLVGGYEPDVALADLGDRGVHYRLRVGVFETRERASTFCDRLKARGRECLVVSS